MAAVHLNRCCNSFTTGVPVLSAFLLALREGVEASLVVGIILVYLSRTGRGQLARFAWYGVAAAVALSLGVAVALERFRISEDGFEGLLLLVASVFVVTMIVWMNRVARHLKKEIEQKVEAYAERPGSAAGWGIFLFVFLMVLREGAELALILRAVELSSEGLQTWIGTIVGIGAAVAVGVFFFVFIFGAAALLVLREWQSASHARAAKEAAGEAEKRLLEAQNRRQRRWMIAAAGACLVVILVLTADFIYTRANSAPPSARAVMAVSNEVRIPLTEVQDGSLHLYTITAGNQSLRFLIIKKPNGYGTALDACRICGAEGYRQDGQNVVCRHCGSAIYVPSVGDHGGCNPIGVPSHMDGGDLLIDISALTQAAKEIPQ